MPKRGSTGSPRGSARCPRRLSRPCNALSRPRPHGARWCGASLSRGLRRRRSLIGRKRSVPLELGDRIVPRLVLLGRQFAAAAAKPVRLLLLFLLLVLLGKLATHLAARLRVPAVHRRLRADPTRKNARGERIVPKSRLRAARMSSNARRRIAMTCGYQRRDGPRAVLHIAPGTLAPRLASRVSISLTCHPGPCARDPSISLLRSLWMAGSRQQVPG